jgi:hypothetical protein
LIKAADMLIARRADTRARADFATWKMMAKLNGASSLPAKARKFLARYRAFLDEMTEGEATEATIILIYTSYYDEMGGVGTPPEMPAPSKAAATDNIAVFKRAPAKRRKTNDNSEAKSRLPVGLIFACLIVVYVGFRYFLR